MIKVCVLFSVLVACSALCSQFGYRVQVVTSRSFVQGYGPAWDSRSNQLIFVDFFNSTVSSYDPENGATYTAILPGISYPTYVIPLKHRPNQYLVNSNKQAVIIEWNRIDRDAEIVRQEFTIETEPKYIGNFGHISLASSNGKFFLGGTFRGSSCTNSTAPNAGFYTYSKESGVIKQKVPMKTVAGVALNAAGDKAYIVDLCNGLIREYDFDSVKGLIANGRVVFKYQNDFGGPLSCLLPIVVDTDGYLYVGVDNGGVILKVDPCTRKMVQVIKVPVKIITGLAWGGEDHRTLFVTSATPFFNILEATVKNVDMSCETPDSGRVFAITGLGATGVVANSFCV